MPPPRPRALGRYLAALAVGVIALVLRAPLESSLGHDAPLLVYVVAVAAASIVGGLGPGVLLTALCTAAMSLSFEPRGHLAVASRRDYVRLALFLVVGAVSSILGERRLRLERTARIEAERAHAALEREHGARAEAERLAQLRDEFLATVSHELRTPLSAILGWAQILLSSPDSREKTVKGLEIIERNARAQAQLVEDLLDTSRLVIGKLQLDVTDVRLDEVAWDAIETARHAANGRGMRIVTEIEPVTVCGEARRLHQIVWNLLTNAVKFGRTGGALQVRVGREGRDAVVEVSDDGRGIDPAFLPYVFDKFRQEDASMARAHGGLGLGLAVSRSLTELHGGSISAHSAGLGAGSTFTVRIPLAPERTPSPACEPRDGAVRGTRLAGTEVLVVDDDADAVETTATVLEHAGARVRRARSGAEALARLASGGVQAVVLDLMMPERDGFEVLRAMREQGNRAPVIALSALAFPSDRARTKVAGFAAHLTKPIESATLVDTIVRSMAAARPTQPAPRSPRPS